MHPPNPERPQYGHAQPYPPQPPPQRNPVAPDPWDEPVRGRLKDAILSGAAEGAADGLKEAALDRLGLPDPTRIEGPSINWPQARSEEHARLLARVQKLTKRFAMGAVLGIGLTAAGGQLLATYGTTTELIAGAVCLVPGLVLLTIGVISHVQSMNLRHDLRRHDPHIVERVSPVAHLPEGRRAAVVGACIMGFAVAVSLGLTGYGVYWLAGMGAYEQPLAAGLTSIFLIIPLIFAASSAVGIRHLLQRDAAGARLGRGLLTLVTSGAVIVAGNMAKEEAYVVAGVTAGIALLSGLFAWQMHRIFRTLRGPVPAGQPPSYGPGAPPHGPGAPPPYGPGQVPQSGASPMPPPNPTYRPGAPPYDPGATPYGPGQVPQSGASPTPPPNPPYQNSPPPPYQGAAPQGPPPSYGASPTPPTYRPSPSAPGQMPQTDYGQTPPGWPKPPHHPHSG